MTITREQLAEWLKGQDLHKLKKQTGLSVRTMCRIKNEGKQPSFETLQLLLIAGAGARKKPRPTPETAKG